MGGGNQQWYLDSGCSRHMTGKRSNFLSLKGFDGGNVVFGNDKEGSIIGLGSIGNTPSQSIENVYLVDGLQHSLLSVSQICDKGNLVQISSRQCMVLNEKIGDVMLRGNRCKNVYMA